jgi:casein kinase II subunit beta
MVPFWKEAMEMVLDVEPGAFTLVSEMSAVSLTLIVDEDSAKIPDVSIVEASAELLYGLVHQRYVLTRAGLHAMVSESRHPCLPS